jgi:hypothetical protein
MADDDIREGGPRKPIKKKAAPPDDDDRPKKRKPSADDDDDAEMARKRKKIAKDDDDDDNDLGSSALSAVIPVGGSIFALLSLWLSVIAGVMAFAGLVLFMNTLASILLPSLWPIALLCGIVSFFTAKHKASYGSIAGNMRAIIGILISLGVMVFHGVLIFMYLSK